MSIVFWVLFVYSTHGGHLLYPRQPYYASYEACDRGRDSVLEPGKTYGVCVPQKADE